MAANQGIGPIRDYEWGRGMTMFGGERGRSQHRVTVVN